MDTNNICVDDSYRITYGPDNAANKVIHIRSVVDDAYYVYRYWSKKSQAWIYKLETIEFFIILNQSGLIEKI